MKYFNTIIFDLDGVIINSEILWDRGSLEFLKRRGLEYDRARTKPLCTGKSLLEGTKIIQETYQLPGKTEDLAQERKEIVTELYKNQLEFIPGFEDFARYLKTQNYKHAIATSCNSDLLQLADTKLGLSQLFHPHIYSIADVNHISKPDPAIFLFAAQKLGETPEHCVVIEDAPNGILAAKCAGMYCIALEGTYTPTLLRKADHIMKSFPEIQEFFVTQASRF